jgi:hypothetical protein
MVLFTRKSSLSKFSSWESCTSASSRKYSSAHSTIINAPAGAVWESLSDIHSWEWNHCVRLDAAYAMAGQSGKSRITNDGRQMYRSFSFRMVKREELTFSWCTKFRLCTCTNTIKLNPLGAKRTELIHTQEFGRYFGFGHPFKKLKKNVCIMSEGLKNHVESLYFNILLSNFSSRDFCSPTEKSDSAVMTDISERSEISATSNFWETPKHLRQKLVKSFVDDQLEHPIIYV